MDPVQNGGSMYPWSIFCPHFPGVNGFNLQFLEKSEVLSLTSYCRQSQNMSNIVS